MALDSGKVCVQCEGRSVQAIDPVACVCAHPLPPSRSLAITQSTLSITGYNYTNNLQGHKMFNPFGSIIVNKCLGSVGCGEGISANTAASSPFPCLQVTDAWVLHLTHLPQSSLPHSVQHERHPPLCG